MVRTEVLSVDSGVVHGRHAVTVKLSTGFRNDSKSGEEQRSWEMGDVASGISIYVQLVCSGARTRCLQRQSTYMATLTSGSGIGSGGENVSILSATSLSLLSPDVP